jgi:hypothetical protein
MFLSRLADAWARYLRHVRARTAGILVKASPERTAQDHIWLWDFINTFRGGSENVPIIWVDTAASAGYNDLFVGQQI